MYGDEVVPGNQLAVRHSRGIWVLYFSFLELHPHLSDELAWCPIAAEPSADLKTVSGGISQVFAEIVKLFFNDDFDLRIGMHLDGPEGEDASCRLFVILSMFLHDGGAHKLLWVVNRILAQGYVCFARTLSRKPVGLSMHMVAT